MGEKKLSTDERHHHNHYMTVLESINLGESISEILYLVFGLLRNQEH